MWVGNVRLITAPCDAHDPEHATCPSVRSHNVCVCVCVCVSAHMCGPCLCVPVLVLTMVCGGVCVCVPVCVCAH